MSYWPRPPPRKPPLAKMLPCRVREPFCSELEVIYDKNQPVIHRAVVHSAKPKTRFNGQNAMTILPPQTDTRSNFFWGPTPPRALRRAESSPKIQEDLEANSNLTPRDDRRSSAGRHHFHWESTHLGSLMRAEEIAEDLEVNSILTPQEDRRSFAGSGHFHWGSTRLGDAGSSSEIEEEIEEDLEAEHCDVKVRKRKKKHPSPSRALPVKPTDSNTNMVAPGDLLKNRKPQPPSGGPSKRTVPRRLKKKD